MILIDPGHGPGDGVVTSRTTEHDYCYSMAVDLAEMPGTMLSRRATEDPANGARAEIARRHGCRLALSLHVNAGPSHYYGAHAFHRPHSVRGKHIAEAIMTAWPKELSRKELYGRWAGTTWVEGAVARPDGKYWPRVAGVFDLYGDVDLVLVEMFYATNPEEEALAHQVSFKEEMSLALRRGVVVAQRGSGYEACL